MPILIYFLYFISLMSLSPSGPLYSLAALSLSAVTLPCADISGDYVLLYWWPPDSPDAKPKLIFQFDRWRDSRTQSDFFVELHNHSSVLSENFSFLLRPELKDAGRYQCEVFRDDQVFAQITVLTVLNGNKIHCTFVF